MKKKIIIGTYLCLTTALSLQAMLLEKATYQNEKGQSNKHISAHHAMMSAVKWGSYATVADLIAEGLDTNYQVDELSMPVICAAIRGNKLEKIALLVAHGANINQAIEEKKRTGSQKKLFQGTPLLYAAFNYNVKAVKRLLYTVPQELIEDCNTNDERDAVDEHLIYLKEILNTKTKNFCRDNRMGQREEIPYVLLFNATGIPPSKSKHVTKICALLDPENIKGHRQAIEEYVTKGRISTLIIF